MQCCTDGSGTIQVWMRWNYRKTTYVLGAIQYLRISRNSSRTKQKLQWHMNVYREAKDQYLGHTAWSLLHAGHFLCRLAIIRWFISLCIPIVMPDQTVASGATLGSAPDNIRYPEFDQLATNWGIWLANFLFQFRGIRPRVNFEGLL